MNFFQYDTLNFWTIPNFDGDDYLFIFDDGVIELMDAVKNLKNLLNLNINLSYNRISSKLMLEYMLDFAIKQNFINLEILGIN